MTRVTVKKDFTLMDSDYFAGTWIEMVPGANVTHEIFNQLLETGAIELGVNQEFIDSVAEQKSKENKEKKHESD